MKHYPSERRLSPQQENDVCDVLILHANNKLKLTLGLMEKKFGFKRHTKFTKIKKNTNHGQKDAEIHLPLWQMFCKEIVKTKLELQLMRRMYYQLFTIRCYLHTTLVSLFLHYTKMHLNLSYYSLSKCEMFPEVLLFDGTYNVNAVGMPLYQLWHMDKILQVINTNRGPT